MRNIATKKSRYLVKSLTKGLKVLETFAEAARPLTISEIAHITGTNRSTINRFCYTLTQLGFIQPNRQKQYHLTPKVLALGCSVVCGLDWPKIAKYYLEQLFDKVQETVNLTVLDGSEALVVLRIRKIKYLPFDIRIGTKLPVHCTAMGKVLMAMGPPEKTRPVLKTLEFPPLTESTITSLDKYLEELKEVRKKGYSINDQELSNLIRAVAAPILDDQNYAIAAVSITVPIIRYGRREMEERLAPHLIRVAREISNALLQIETPLPGESDNSFH